MAVSRQSSVVCRQSSAVSRQSSVVSRQLRMTTDGGDYVSPIYSYDDDDLGFRAPQVST